MSTQGSEVVGFPSPPATQEPATSAIIPQSNSEINSTLSSWMDFIDQLIELPPESVNVSSSPAAVIPTNSGTTSLSPPSTGSFESFKRQKMDESPRHFAPDHRPIPFFTRPQYQTLPQIRSAPEFTQFQNRTSPKRPFPITSSSSQVFSPVTISHNLQMHSPAFSSGYSGISPKQKYSVADASGAGMSEQYLNFVPSSTNYMVAPESRTNSSIFNPSINFLQPQSKFLQERSSQDLASSFKALRRSQSEEMHANGLRLVHLLLACADAVSTEDYILAEDLLLQLEQAANVNGDSMQRVAAYFTSALHSRLTGTGHRSYETLAIKDCQSWKERLDAYQIVYQACPYIKFSHLCSNQAIFEAFDGEDNVHIIDLHIMEGYQWPAFIQALADRPGGAPHLRVTGIGTPLEAVREAGTRLCELAESLNVPFEFHAVGETLENVKAHMLQRRIGEALAVNSVNVLHRLLSEPSSPLFSVLYMIKEQAPSVFTIVEQEASHTGQFFLSRFLEALHYYSAIFDSLDATLPQNSLERTKVEHLIFGQEITNIVACEGYERIERHQKLDKWRKLMEGIGFQNVPMSAKAVNQSRLLLGLYSCDGYTLEEDNGCLLLGWQDRPIIAASSWRC